MQLSDLMLTSSWIIAPLSTELKGLGADFVFGFVQSMDGERDPRNLLLAFQVAKNIIQRGYELGEGSYMGYGFTAVLYRRLFIVPICFLR